jgi:hypothetical protein
MVERTYRSRKLSEAESVFPAVVLPSTRLSTRMSGAADGVRQDEKDKKDSACQKKQLIDGRRKSGLLAICGNAVLDRTGAATAKARKNELSGERLSSCEQRIIDGKGDDSPDGIARAAIVSAEPWRVPMQCASATAGLARPQRSAAAVGSMEAVAGAVCFFLM